MNLGGLYYDLKLKDSVTTGLSAIEKKIKNLSAEISPKIKSTDLKTQLKDASSKMGSVSVGITANATTLKDSIKTTLSKGYIKALVGVDAVKFRESIRTAMAKTDFKANVSAYAVALRKSIKDAIAVESYKAKIVADATSLTTAIQKQVNQQTYTAKVTLTATSSTQDKQKKTQEVTNTKKKKKQDEPIKIKVDASSAPKDIQTAINKGTYTATAKVGADTKQLVDAINKAIPQEKKIQITGAVGNGGSTGTTGGTTSGGGKSSSGSKSDNDAKAAQRAYERQQKAESKAYENHLKGMQKMRETYEKDKWTAIRKGGMSKPKDTITPTWGINNSIRLAGGYISRIMNNRKEAYELKNEIKRLGNENAELSKQINNSGSLKSYPLQQRLNENLEFLKAYKKEYQSLQAEYKSLSANLHAPQANIPKYPMGLGAIPTNHSEMQRKWEEHFAWKDREMKQTTAGNMRMSADDAKKAAEAAKREAQASEEAKRAEEAKAAAIRAAAQQRKQAANEARKYATDMQRVASEMNNVGSRSGWLHDQLQNVFSMYGVQQFLQNLIMIGGEFEKQRIALGALFKNTEKGNDTFGEIKKWSVKSPFTFSQLTSYTKQLASFGFQYRDVLDTTKKLADISAGVGVDMGRVILAYGQVFTAKFLRGPELRQFTEAGIPMVDELSKVLTERMQKKVSAADVYKLISSREVKFEDVEKVINKITGEGGTFYKMQEKQSQSLVGKWTNLKDAIEIMYSDIESANNGWLKGSISLLTKLALNWKSVGISILAVASAYGLLRMKNRLVYATAAREASLIATMDAKKAAIDSQTMSYNRLAEAIAKKNYEEGKYYGNSLGVFGRNGMQRNAALRMSERLVLNGTPASQITPIYAAGSVKATPNADGTFTYKGTVDKEFQERIKSAEYLRRKLNYLKQASKGSILDGKTWALWGTQAQVAMRNVSLSLKAIGASIASTAAAMLPMMAITAAVGGFIYYKQNQAEQENRTKEMIDGAKSSYKEISDYLKNNPIEVAIRKKDPNDLKEIIENYREQARNSPINIDFAISYSKNMSSATDQLSYLRRQIEYVAMAEQYASKNGAGIAKGIKEKTGGWFNDDYAENVKDYAESIDELNKSASKIEDKDISEFISKLDATSVLSSSRKEALALAEELKKLRSEGASTKEILETINNSEYYREYSLGSIWGSGNIKDGVDAYRNYKFSQVTLDEDSQEAAETVREKLEAIPNALDSSGRMTDLGHTMMVRFAQSIGEDAGLVKEQIDMIVGDLEGRFKPSMDATWQESSQAMNALMDQMRANCADLFQGMDLSGGFTEQQRRAIQACIDKAPAECDRYTKIWQALLDSHQLYIRVGSEFNATGLKGELPTDIQSIWNSVFRNNKKYGRYAPGKGENIVSWSEARAASLDSNLKELRSLQKAPKTSQSQMRINNLTDEVNNEKYVFKTISPYDYAAWEEKANKKENAANKKAKAAADKAQRERDKKQREYEASLRKEFNQIKRVREMYEKLRELYGDEGAMDKIRKSGLIRADLIPKDVHSMEDFLKKYRAIMKKFYNSYKATTDNLKDLNSQVAQDLLNLQFDQEKEALDKAVSTLETQLERAGDAWKRYKDLLSEGMNMPLAKFMVYGDMGSYNMVESDDTGSQRLSMLRERAAKHIEEKTKTSPSDYNMDRYLGMNEEELKTEFGNNEKVTKGLWTIVKTYQEVAKTIRSENDKLISQLYKDSLSYAAQIEGIARKHKRERATIKEKEAAYAPAKQRYDRAVQQGANIEGRLKYQQGLAESSNEYKKWELANASYELDKGALEWHDEQVKEGKEPSTNRKDLQKQVNEAKTAADTAWNVYIKTDAYKGIAPLEEEQKKNAEEQKIAKEKLSDTLPPNVANALLTQSKINERNEKSEVSQKVIEGSDGYIELFNNIYNLASKTANEIADNLIDTLDEKLAHGEINQETYTNMRNEISQKRNEVYEKGTDSKNAKLWQVGFGGITKNKIQQAQSEQETAGKEMNSIQAQIDQNDAAITSEEKAQRIASIKQQIAKANEDYNTAEANNDESAKQLASNTIGELNRQLIDTENTATLTPEERTTRGAYLQKQYDDAKERYEAADQAGNAAAKKQAKQDMIQGGFGMAANMGQNLTQFRDTLGSTMDAFGMNTDQNEGFQKFSTAVDVMSDVSSGMSNAMQSMMSGDFVGAAFSIIETPMNIANAFAKLHDKKLDIQINQSKQLMEEVKTASEDLKNAIQSSLGAEDAKNRALSRQGEMAQILSDAGVKDTEGAGFVYGMVSGKTSGSDLISQNRNKYYGKDGKVTDQEYRSVFKFGKFLANTIGGSWYTLAATPEGTAGAAKGAIVQKRNEEAKAFDRMADALEKAGYGNHSQVSVYGAEYASLLEQRKQAEYQMKMEQDKSNTDDDKIKEYKNQIKDLTKQIHEYMSNLAKELYGIDFSSWANKLGDALTNAFRNGEDAAAAFHDAVGDIMADLVKNMIITDAIKPMFTKLEEYLFGKDGSGGAFDINDTEGSIKKIVPYISSFFNDVENSVPGWEKLYDVLNEASGGIVKKTSSSSSSLSGSIKGITEETSTLLASYINAIRLDVSVNRKTFKDLAEVTIPKMSVIAENQLRQLNVIAEQTTKIEENTRKNYEAVELIRSYISSVSTTTSGGKAIRTKM